MVMAVSRSIKPEIIQQFENLLWVDTPKSWVIKTVFYQNTLYISAIIEIDKEHTRKIRRTISMEIITSRQDDIWGLATDMVDEMKSELKEK